MKIVILTGSIAMGKSSIADLLRKRNIDVFCADACVHSLYKQPQIVKKIAAMFNNVVVDKEVNRQKLANQIMHNEGARIELEHFIHEKVRQKEIEFLEQLNKAQKPSGFIDMALYFENGAFKRIGNYIIDAVIVVQCSLKQQRARALARSGMSEEKLQKIIDLQLPSALKAERADYVIDNSKDIEYSEKQLDVILDKIGL